MDAVLNWLWQGCVVAAALCVMLRMLERARANVRYVVCWAALLLVVALPAVPWLTAGAPEPRTAASMSGDVILTLPEAWWTSSMLMLIAWGAWASVYTIRFTWSLIALWRARSRSVAFPPHVESVLPHWSGVRFQGRRAPLVLSNSVPTAAVLGCGAPVIAVSPSVVTTLDAGELDRVLVHEWAHVQRRDDLVNLLQIVVRIAAGWHPAVWWIDRRLHVEREIACDEMTVAITGSPKTYATCLMKLAGIRVTARPMQAAPAVFTASGLRARVTKIVSPYPSIGAVWSRSLAAVVVSTLCVMSAGVGGQRLVVAAAFAPPTVSAPILGTAPHSLAPLAVPAPSSSAGLERPSFQATVSAPSAQRPTKEEPARLPVPTPEPATPPTSDAVNVVEPPPAAPVAADRTVVSERATVSPVPSPPPADATAEAPGSPWSVAAGQGAALGRKSKDAGVATAGFFNRFGRRVAGSF